MISLHKTPRQLSPSSHRRKKKLCSCTTASSFPKQSTTLLSMLHTALNAPHCSTIPHPPLLVGEISPAEKRGPTQEITNDNHGVLECCILTLPLFFLLIFCSATHQVLGGKRAEHQVKALLFPPFPSWMISSIRHLFSSESSFLSHPRCQSGVPFFLPA